MIIRVVLLLFVLCIANTSLAHTLRHVHLGSTQQSAESTDLQALVNQGKAAVAERQILSELEIARAQQNKRDIANNLHGLGHISLTRNDYLKALQQFQSALDFYKLAQEPLAMADLYTDIGRTYRDMGLYESALGYFNLAREIYHAKNRQDGIALQQLEVGISLRQLGQFESALSQLERALPLLRQENDIIATATALMNIARVYSDVGKNEEAIVYLKDASLLVETLPVKTLSAELEYHLGRVNSRIGNYDVADRHLSRSRSLSADLGAHCDISKVDTARGELLISRQQLQSGIKLLTVTQQQATKHNCITLLTDIHLALAKAYLDNDQELLSQHIRLGLQEAQERAELFTQANFEALKVQMYERQGDFEKALKALKNQRKLEQQSIDQRRSLALLYLQTQLDVERKAQSLELLSKNQAIQLAKAEQQELEVRMLYASLFAITLFVFLLWSRFNQRQRSLFLKREVRRRTQELESKNNEIEEAYTALERASLLDPLTGLYNRQYLNNQLPQEINRAQQAYYLQKEPNSEGSQSDIICFLLDVDNFKQINDTHGHLAGDRILIELGKVMRSVFRPSDMLIRWGGEEFLAVCRNTNRQEAVSIAERLHQSLHAHNYLLNKELRLKITCSIGFCVIPLFPGEPGRLNWENYFSILDDCLYAAKKSGKDCWIGVTGDRKHTKNVTQTPLELKYNLPPTRIQTSLNHLSSIVWE